MVGEYSDNKRRNATNICDITISYEIINDDKSKEFNYPINIEEAAAAAYFSQTLFEDYEEIYSNKNISFEFSIESDTIWNLAVNLQSDKCIASQTYIVWLEPTGPLITDPIKKKHMIRWWSWNMEKFKDLANTALRLLSIPTNEACAERMLWKQNNYKPKIK